MGNYLNYPDPYVFSELAGRGAGSWEEYGTDPNFDYDPNAKDDYEFVEEGKEVDSTYRYDPAPMDYVVIRRKSDGKYFKMSVHYESWSSVEYNETGEYGGIWQVQPVQKIAYERVR
jgi:hypothetical protein